MENGRYDTCFILFILGPLLCRNIPKNSSIIAKNQGRNFTAQHLKRELANGEVVDRNWVVYSPSKNSIFCFMCRLFQTSASAASDVFATNGFTDFHNTQRAFQRHENAKSHALCELTYKTRSKESNTRTLDTSIMNQSEKEMEYWRSILKRIVAVIKFLGSRGLPFRGADQTMGSVRNGNFLGVLDLLSQFDPLLASHIERYGNKGRGIISFSSYLIELTTSNCEFQFYSGRSSYLSDTICDEFIKLIGIKVLDKILSELRDAKYFSISVDSTPDVSHCDQLVFCIRYVKDGVPVERFLQFIPINQHKSEYLTDTVIEFMSSHSIELQDCRGQSYDNTNNMAGKYSGLQQRILEMNPFAIFMPCAAHSLNLVGSAAVSGNKKATSFFCFMENIYSFFVKSTLRWDLLKEALEPNQRVLKRATGTRWSAKFDAVNALNGNILQVQAVLLRILNDDSLQTTNENKALATGVLRELCKFENILMLKIWYAILVKFNMVNRTLQKSDLNISVAAQLYQSLVNHVETLKSQFDSFFNDAKSLYAKLEADEYTFRTRAAITSENMDDKKSYLKDTIFDPVLESLMENLKTRMHCYMDMDEKFSFLVKLNELDIDEISKKSQELASFYANDIDAVELISECEIAKQHFFKNLPPNTTLSHASMYFCIVKDELQSVFPNIEIILRIFLSLFVTNVPDERSFSKLKYIKDTLRNRLSEEKLNAFSLMSIEFEILDSLNLDEIIDEFVLLKNRKKNIGMHLHTS